MIFSCLILAFNEGIFSLFSWLVVRLKFCFSSWCFVNELKSPCKAFTRTIYFLLGPWPNRSRFAKPFQVLLELTEPLLQVASHAI